MSPQVINPVKPLLNMKSNISNRTFGPSRKTKTRGATLPDMMVSLGLGSLVLMVMAMVFNTSARSFATLGHYVSMDRNSRNAQDQMTTEIRNAGDLVEFSSSHLKFTALGQTNSFLVYDWDATSRQLTQWKTGQSTTNVLLTECDELAFSLQKVSLASTTVVSDAKAVNVTWKCSRTLLGNKVASEDMDQALIIIRNKRI
jgi:hypothetical protein